MMSEGWTIQKPRSNRLSERTVKSDGEFSLPLKCYIAISQILPWVKPLSLGVAGCKILLPKWTQPELLLLIFQKVEEEIGFSQCISISILYWSIQRERKKKRYRFMIIMYHSVLYMCISKSPEYST